MLHLEKYEVFASAGRVEPTPHGLLFTPDYLHRSSTDTCPHDLAHGYLLTHYYTHTHTHTPTDSPMQV